MPPQATSRKRPAPGTAPTTMQEQPTSLQFPAGGSSPQLTNDEFLNWGNKAPTNIGSNVVSNAGSNYSDPNAPYNSNLYHSLSGGITGMGQQSNVMHHHPPAAPSPPSNQIARRPANQSLVSRSRAFGGTNNNLWPGDFGSDGTRDLQGISGWNTEDDIEERAQVAKREAQAKRKQIPPFVQKLSSFLDQSKNTELIRWSDSGDSFIVLDEDEFAKTLIPELFKHNNYASFVRQLNMYGFHKKVGLSDNSMKASERKNKSPSEYHNPYFKRGHPDLLWLINKPKNSQSSNRDGKKSGRKGSTKVEDGDRQSDDDASGDENEEYLKAQSGQRDGTRGMSAAGNGGGGGRVLIGPNDVGNALARRDLADVRSQLESIRQHQKAISTAITRLRKDHNQLYEQAVAFQTLHDRHESSINAILTFLATVYNRSLEGHGGQNFANMFGNAIPHEPQPQGNVVDVGEVVDQPQGNQIQRRFRRQPLRLTAPPNTNQDAQTGRISTVSPAASGSSAQSFQNSYDQGQQGQYLQPNQVQNTSQSGSVEELFDPQGLNQTAESPSIKPDIDTLNRSPNMPQRDILSFINSANATNNMQGARLDFGSALSHYENANGNSPLTPKQRNAMLHLIANNANVSSGSSNNALLSPTPPPMPSLDQFGSTQQELEMLAKLQAEQDAKVQQLTSIVQPLSPTGEIPGLTDGQYFNGQGLDGGAGALDLDQIFNSSDYFSNQGNGEMDFVNDAGFGDGVDLFSSAGDCSNDMQGFDGGADDPGGRVVEAVDSSESTSPANTIDTLEDGGSPSKRRRRT